MNRLGLMHPSALGGRHMTETKAVYDALSRHDTVKFGNIFTYRLASTGALVGLDGVLLHTPEVAATCLAHIEAIRRLPGLSDRTREIAILTVAVYERSFYQIYARTRTAYAHKVDQMELSELRAGRCPTSFDGQDGAAFQLARELTVNNGPLSQQAWNAAMLCLGRQGAVAIIQWVAFARYITALERGFDTQVPAERDRVENRYRDMK